MCEREGAKALIGGSILKLGDKYVLDLDATDCLTGNRLDQESVEATSQEQVLRQMGRVIIALRRKLGESIASLQKFDTPIEQATTRSLAALKAYTEGDLKRLHGRDEESIPDYKMATELDPDFATAWARLGAIYTNLQQTALADEYLKKAFEVREHLTEREKLYIQAHYYVDSTAETDKGIETYELWTQIYPHDWIPFNNLSNEYQMIGKQADAVRAGQAALRLNPYHGFPYAALSRAYEWSTRFAEAKTVCEKANTERLDSWNTHIILYEIALAEGDDKAAQRESQWFEGNPLVGWRLFRQAMDVLSRGRAREARELFERARASSLQQNMAEFAGSLTQDQAQSEADLGMIGEAKSLTDLSLRIMPDSPKRKAFAALIFARTGDIQRAESLAQQASRAQPHDLLLNRLTLACVRASLEIDRNDPAAAVAELQPASAYDYSAANGGVSLYYRGEALLKQGSAREAAAEFQKLLDNHGAAGFYWPLAFLGLGRSYAQLQDREKSRAAYRQFLDLWKNADPDLLILKQAKAEYAKLQ